MIAVSGAENQGASIPIRGCTCTAETDELAAAYSVEAGFEFKEAPA
jgi:hypothetical protein